MIKHELFNTLSVPTTESIKYAGSKLKLLPHILRAVEDLDIKTVFDGFSGSTRVSQAFAQLGYQVVANDISEWSYVLGTAYLRNTRNKAYYSELINHLNNVQGYCGWFSKYYGGDPNKGDTKRPFQLHNTMRLDGIRDEIDRLNLDKIDKAVALTSLMLALDSVDNTLGHYVAYLSNWAPRSYKQMQLKVPQLFINRQENQILKGNIFDSLKNITADLAYYDPPYGSNNEKMPPSRVRYSSYYHIWTSVILNDKPQLFGKANRREDTRDVVSSSIFEEYKTNKEGQHIAMLAIRRLIEETPTKYILLSYSSGGRATKEELYNIMTNNGTLLQVWEIDYKTNIMGSMRWTNEWATTNTYNKEYLFLLQKY